MFYVVSYCSNGNIQVYVERFIDYLHSSYAVEMESKQCTFNCLSSGTY